MKNPIAKLLRPSPETEIERVRGKRDAIYRRYQAAVLDAEQAAAKQRALLIESDEIDEAALAKAEAACRVADDRKAATEAACREVSQRLTDLEAAYVSKVDQAERDRVAAELEARAQRVEKAAANLDRVAEKFAEVRAEVLRVCHADALFDALSGGSPALNIAHAGGYLSGAVPHSDHDKMMGVPESAIGAAIPAVEKLRRLAAAVREGSAPALLPATHEAYLPIAIPEESVVLSRPVEFSGRLGQLQHVTAGGVMLPAPIAAAARKMGIAFDFDSTEGKAILAAGKRPGMGAEFNNGAVLKKNDVGLWIVDQGEINLDTGKPRAPEMFVFIPVNLHDWEAAERARLRAAA